MAPHDFEEQPRGEDHPTLVPCLSCSGDFERLVTNLNNTHSMIRCKWCSSGSMDSAQIARYHAHQQGRER